MRYRHGIVTLTAALSAAIATGPIVAYLSGANPRSQVVLAAEAAITFGMAALLLSVFVAYLLARRQPRLRPALWGALDSRPAAGDCVACLHKRREVLVERLKIDEPRLCSQYVIACTCWSFCAGTAGNSSVGEGTSPAAQMLIRVRNLLPQAKRLPVVHRNGIDNCPFRFTSPLRRVSPR